MRISRFLAALIVGMGCAGCGAGRGGVASRELFPPDSLAGWRVSNWADVSQPQQAEGEAWVRQGDVITGTGKHTWLISPQEYGDFVLTFEWKITPGTNGGVGLRFPPEGDPAYAGLEIQIVDGAGYYKGSGRPNQLTGSIYDEAAATAGAARPVGEWNRQRITCRGSRVTVEINGKTVLDADLGAHTKAQNEKGASPLAHRPRRGHIGFQNIHGVIELRGVRLARLD